jgi:NAD(P)H-hydrate epimerase
MCEAGRDASEGLDAEADLVVDALFGTGFHGEPRLDAAELIERINTASAPVVAVDLPSGVDASTGEVAGAAVRADVTVTMHGSKVGLAVAPGTFYAGEIEIADIGLEDGETAHRLVTSAVLAGVPPRKRRDNKYTAGSVLVVGGSPGYTGALCLAAEAAFRADAGYVAVAAPRESLAIVEQRLLEVVKTELDDVDEAAERASAVAIGPGLGRGDDEKALVRRLLEQLDTPIVLDADALHELEPFQREAATVLTPHDGELARLIGEESTWVAAHRLEALHRGVERFACVVLLKGADTLIGAPGEPVLVHSSDTPGLATAGSGDVLTGIVAAFLAKGVDHRVAPAAAVAAQTEAARRLPQRGLIASDVIDQLPHVFPSCTALS